MSMEGMNPNAHLSQEEFDLLLESGTERAASAPPRLERHLERCAACRREAAALRNLHVHLSRLPYLEARTGFTERVMSRIQLPVPWYRWLWAAFRERMLVLTATLVAVGAAAGAGAWWIFGQGGVQPVELATYVLEGLRTVLLRAVVALGRFAYEVGAVELLGEMVRGVDPVHVLAVLGAVGAAGLAALLSAMKLMETPLGRTES